MLREAYVFAQFLRLLSRYEFQRIVEKYNGDYRTKQLKCWHQLACMMFAHIRQENSLRDIDTEYVVGYSPMRDSLYAFVATEQASADFVDAFSRSQATRLLDQYGSDRCMIYSASARNIIKTSAYLLNLVRGTNTEEELDERGMVDTHAAYIIRQS